MLVPWPSDREVGRISVLILFCHFSPLTIRSGTILSKYFPIFLFAVDKIRKRRLLFCASLEARALSWGQQNIDRSSLQLRRLTLWIYSWPSRRQVPREQACKPEHVVWSIVTYSPLYSHRASLINENSFVAICWAEISRVWSKRKSDYSMKFRPIRPGNSSRFNNVWILSNASSIPRNLFPWTTRIRLPDEKNRLCKISQERTKLEKQKTEIQDYWNDHR